MNYFCSMYNLNGFEIHFRSSDAIGSRCGGFGGSILLIACSLKYANSSRIRCSSVAISSFSAACACSAALNAPRSACVFGCLHKSICLSICSAMTVSDANSMFDQSISLNVIYSMCFCLCSILKRSTEYINTDTT